MSYPFENSSGGSGGATSSGGLTTYPNPVYYPDGSATDPALSFSNDIHKGFFATPTGVGAATNGTQRLFIDNNGAAMFTGSLSVAGAAAITGALTLGAGAGVYNITAASPNGNVTALPGSVAFSSTGGPNATLWVKEAGFDNQGWVSVSRPTAPASCAQGLPTGACVSLSGSMGNYTATIVNIAQLNTTPAVGIALTVSGTTSVICFSGVAAGIATNMTPNSTMYVGPSGVVTTDISSLSTPYYLQPIGRAINATDGVISIGDVTLYRGS